MDEVSRPRSRGEPSRIDVDEQALSLVCQLEEFNKHEVEMQKNLKNTSVAGAKRKRVEGSESDEQHRDEEGFILVEKKNKRLVRNAEKIQNNIRGYNNNNKRNTNSFQDPSSIEVCMSSSELLPKQIGLAKLLKSENIPNITEMKYKTPYKVFMKFETRADAEKLINNSKLVELGFRCRFTNEINFIYGLIRYIETEMKEEELLKDFTAESEIVSVKRLKRMNEAGQWSDCETVRICFKSPSLPQYVYGYGCRFKIEPYTFPVNQCSVCWKFGHLARMCPSSKKKCPKCCGEHENCETNNFRCINCKGKHMAFYKKCPIYLKEKEIRRIMCEENCTYKVAFVKFTENKSYYVREEMLSSEKNNSQDDNTQEQVVTEAVIHNEWPNLTESEGDMQIDDTKSSEEENVWTNIVKNKKKKKKPQKNIPKEDRKQPEKEEQKNSGQSKNAHNEKETQRRKKGENSKTHEEERSSDKFRHIISKLQNILLAESSFEEKIQLCIKFLFEEVMRFLVGVVSNGQIIRKLINLFQDG